MSEISEHKLKSKMIASDKNSIVLDSIEECDDVQSVGDNFIDDHEMEENGIFEM